MVAADSVYGVGELEMELRRGGKGYVLGVHANHGFRSWSAEISVTGEAQEIAKALPADIWQSLSAGHGIKGERLYDWAYLRLADLDAADYDAAASGLWTRGLLIRRSMSDGEPAQPPQCRCSYLKVSTAGVEAHSPSSRRIAVTSGHLSLLRPLCPSSSYIP